MKEHLALYHHSHEPMEKISSVYSMKCITTFLLYTTVAMKPGCTENVYGTLSVIFWTLRVQVEKWAALVQCAWPCSWGHFMTKLLSTCAASCLQSSTDAVELFLQRSQLESWRSTISNVRRRLKGRWVLSSPMCYFLDKWRLHCCLGVKATNHTDNTQIKSRWIASVQEKQDNFIIRFCLK